MSQSGGRPQWLVPAGIALFIVALVVVAVVREPVQLDPSSPEGVVQEYLQAIGEEDYGRALGMLEQEEFGGCVAADLARFAPNEPFTATLDEDAATPPPADDETVRVGVRMRFGSDGLFGNSWEAWETFTLVDRQGTWKIIEDPWPHFSWDCAQKEDT